ncbi:unnamed protein product [Lathyrus oleraceus]|uniref:Protein unc-13 homolog n=1 Tax=Pisum sativum TaxID=3888 RepID=A0A9D5GWM8_PEA|nr:protein unc-13 homolog [Pisum sativum]KAI5444121.1 hypothetical protein KIW84_012654 [Pisum sativum]
MGLYNRRHDSSPTPCPPTISVPPPYNHPRTRHESSPFLSISPPSRPPSPNSTKNINFNRRDSLPPSFPPNSPPAPTSHFRRDSYPGPFPNLPSPSSSSVSEPPLPLYHNRRESCPNPFPFPVSPYHESTDLSLLPSTSSSRNLNHRLLKRRLDIRNKDNYNDNNNGLVWPFYDIKFLDDDDIRETAYEVFFTACRSSPGFGGRSALTFYSKHENGGMGGTSPSNPMPQTSRMKRALGLKILKSSLSQRMVMRGSWTMSMSSPPSPVTVTEGSPRPRVVPRRIMTMAEVMRLQMGVSEQSDSRLRKTLMRTLVGQLGRQAETIILPLELLRHLKPSEFSNPHEYHLWQKRQLKILEAGLLLHPSIPVEKTNTFAMNLKEIIRSGELKPIDTSKNSETMRTFSNSVVSLSMRSPDGVPTNVCHWANGFPVNVHLYISLLQSIFDLEDETSVLDEVDELLELMKKTWSTLGINRSIHNLCFAWTLFQQYVATGQREPDLLCASHTMFNEVANDVKKEKEALYVNMLKSVLGSLQSWADKRLLNYHEYFQGESIRQIENLLPVVLLASKILGDVTISDGDWQNKGDSSAERVDDYIRSSLKNAFEMIIEAENAKSAKSEIKKDISEVMLDLAKDTEDLAMKERRTYSPILKKWHTIAGAVAALTLNNCYGHVLKQYLSEMIKTITVELILVLQRARRLEDVLVQMVVQDSADCEDGGKTVVREMVPFEVDLTIMDLMRKWIGESLEKGNVCLQRAKETETWNPKSKSEPYAKSVVELMTLAKKIVQDFFQIPIAITEDLVQELADGLHKIFKEYTMFIAACGLKENYVPSLPPLTRCNRNSKFHKLWKIASPCNVSCEDPHIYGIYDSSHPHSCTSRGTQRLYIRLNTLHYLLSHISSLDKSLTLTQGVVPSDRFRCSTDINKTQGKSTSYFETVNNSISAACQHLSEVASYRLIFFDSNSFFYDSLYVGDVANARINNAVTVLKHNIKLMTAILTERAQPSLIKEIMKACFHAFLLVLLAGGTTRMFNESDHVSIQEDFQCLKQEFYSCGEELIAESVVDKEGEVVEGVIGLMGMNTEELMENLSNFSSEIGNGMKLAMPPTTGKWNSADPNTILRVLCYRNDRVANHFLKRTFQIAKRR